MKDLRHIQKSLRSFFTSQWGTYPSKKMSLSPHLGLPLLGSTAALLGMNAGLGDIMGAEHEDAAAEAVLEVALHMCDFASLENVDLEDVEHKWGPIGDTADPGAMLACTIGLLNRLARREHNNGIGPDYATILGGLMLALDRWCEEIIECPPWLHLLRNYEERLR